MAKVKENLRTDKGFVVFLAGGAGFSGFSGLSGFSRNSRFSRDSRLSGFPVSLFLGAGCPSRC